MSVFDALPLLEGWDTVALNVVRDITKGSRSRLVLWKEKSWLLGFTILAFDAYASVDVWIDRKPFPGRIIIEDGWTSGSYNSSNQSLWVSTYQRPNPLSTAGVYMVSYDPSVPIPYNKVVELYGELTEDSTQTESAISIDFIKFKIVDMDKFLESYRKIFGTVPVEVKKG